MLQRGGVPLLLLLICGALYFSGVFKSKPKPDVVVRARGVSAELPPPASDVGQLPYIEQPTDVSSVSPLPFSNDSNDQVVLQHVTVDASLITPLQGIGTHGSDDGINRVTSVGNGSTPPSLVSKVDPTYSEMARAAKISGTVTLSLMVNPDGTPRDIRIVKSLGMGLDEKAIEAVRKWRFNPGRNNGTPVRAKAQIEVNFRLR